VSHVSYYSGITHIYMYECVSTSDKISCVHSDCQKYNFVRRKTFKAGIFLNISRTSGYRAYIYFLISITMIYHVTILEIDLTRALIRVDCIWRRTIEEVCVGFREAFRCFSQFHRFVWIIHLDESEAAVCDIINCAISMICRIMLLE